MFTIDGQTFETPAFEDGVAIFGGVPCAVIEAFPGRGTERDVAHQADGAVLKGFTHIDDLAEGEVRVEIRAFFRWIGDVVQGNERSCVLETGFSTEPLVTAALGIEPVGSKGITIDTQRTTVVVIAPLGPSGFVGIGSMATQIDDAFGTQLIGGVQEGIVSNACISGDDAQVQVRVKGTELEQQSGRWILLTGARRQEVVQEHKAEAARGFGPLQYETAIAKA
jgi:hypothetical protein